MTKKVTVATVQFKWKLEDYRSSEAFRLRINKIMEKIRCQAHSRLPLLVAFPEDIGTPMLLFDSYDKIKCKTTFPKAVRSLIMSNLKGVLKYKLKYNVSFIRALILYKSPALEREYVSIFSDAARRYNAYIAAGSITLPEAEDGAHNSPGKDVYNISYFFGPEGNIIGRQKKVYLVDFEGKSGFDLSRGSLGELNVFDTPFGRVGIAICLDAFKEDVCDRLSSLGADIMIQPSANNVEWSKEEQEDWLNGAYLCTFKQKKFKYAINPMMNGNIFDLCFEGQSSIVSHESTLPNMNYSLLQPRSGFLSTAKSSNNEEILIEIIDI